MFPLSGDFDTLPAASVVIALIVARRGKLTWAYIALAVGTLLKLYPVALIPLFLIASWRARDREPFWRGPALYAAIVGLGEGLAALIARGDVMAPFTFMSARCVQVESLPATLGLHLGASFWRRRHLPLRLQLHLRTDGKYRGRADGRPHSGDERYRRDACALRARRLTLGASALLIVAALILGSKVLSPQYLLWLSPLVALEYGLDGVAVLGWGGRLPHHDALLPALIRRRDGSRGQPAA